MTGLRATLRSRPCAQRAPLELHDSTSRTIVAWSVDAERGIACSCGLEALGSSYVEARLTLQLHHESSLGSTSSEAYRQRPPQ